jgi:hypothetical protein
MRIQRRHHTAERRLDQLLVVDRDDIDLLDDGQDVAEQLQLTEGLVSGRLAGHGHGGDAERQDGATDEEAFTHSVSFERPHGRLELGRQMRPS